MLVTVETQVKKWF